MSTEWIKLEKSKHSDPLKKNSVSFMKYRSKGHISFVIGISPDLVEELGFNSGDKVDVFISPDKEKVLIKGSDNPNGYALHRKTKHGAIYFNATSLAKMVGITKYGRYKASVDPFENGIVFSVKEDPDDK